MAGDDERDRIAPERRPDGARRARAADARRERRVRGGLAERHLPRAFEHPALEDREPRQVHRHLEVGSPPVEVFVQLLPSPLGVAARRGPRRLGPSSAPHGHDSRLARVDDEAVADALDLREAPQRAARDPPHRVGLDRLGSQPVPQDLLEVEQPFLGCHRPPPCLAPRRSEPGRPVRAALRISLPRFN